MILAAGASTRLGRPKQLLDLGGVPVIRHVCDAALLAPLDEVVVVLGQHADSVRAALPPDPRLRSIVNERSAAGQSTSLIAGLEAMDPRAGAVLVLLGDQPEVRADAISLVVERWRTGGGRVVLAGYEGRGAHPMLFDRRVWPELARTTGDEGARGILAAHLDWQVLVEVGGRPPRDIDTDADYERLRASFPPEGGRPAH